MAAFTRLASWRLAPSRLARRIALGASVAVMAGLAVAAPVKTAAADGWHHGYGYNRGGVFFSFGVPVYPRPYYYPRPVYYYPPAPVYYAPPPVYYPPAPVYGAPYGQPGVSFGITVPIH